MNNSGYDNKGQKRDMRQKPRGPHPRAVVVSEDEKRILSVLANSRESPHSLVTRAKIIMHAASGMRNQHIADELAVHINRVRRWRKRWQEKASVRQLEAETDKREQLLQQAVAEVLSDAPRSGSPGTFTAEQICQIIRVACQRPEELDCPVTHWTPRELALEVVKQNIVTTISPRQVGRFLKASGVETPSVKLLAQ